MRAQSALGDVLFGKARGAILALLYGQPDKQFYYRQITREISDASPGTLQRELDTLSHLGLIERFVAGNQVFYKANLSYPVYPELRALIRKTVGTFQLLRSALEPLADKIAVAFVYGSMARHEEKADSDIDLMVVGLVSLEDVVEHLSEIERSLRRTLSPTVYSVAEFTQKLKRGNHFLNSVLRREKVFLIGDENELGKVAGIRMAQKRANQPR